MNFREIDASNVINKIAQTSISLRKVAWRDLATNKM